LLEMQLIHNESHANNSMDSALTAFTSRLFEHTDYSLVTASLMSSS
jgi:hypothetical protein